MKKNFFLCMFALCATASWANGSAGPIDQKQRIAEEGLLSPIRPTYLDGVVATSGWGSNWFIEAKGGASAFLGSPIGCGDFFDRTMTVLQVGLGKWFTPAVGGRVAYQGLQFKNANLQTMDYQFVHADFLYNLTHNLQQNEYGLSKLDVIPFVGVGMVRNASSPAGYLQTDGASSGNHPFAFSYGVELRYPPPKKPTASAWCFSQSNVMLSFYTIEGDLLVREDGQVYCVYEVILIAFCGK